jgi:hypothetical protein
MTMLLRNSRALGLAALSVTLLATAACGKKDTAPAVDSVATAPAAPAPAPVLTVSSVTLGKRIGADKMVATADTASVFARRDTIYASVMHEGAPPSATLAARWTFQSGQVVDSTSQTINPTGPGMTEFHISKATAWPTGNYKVEILLDGASVSTKEFQIR